MTFNEANFQGWVKEHFIGSSFTREQLRKAYDAVRVIGFKAGWNRGTSYLDDMTDPAPDSVEMESDLIEYLKEC